MRSVHAKIPRLLGSRRGIISPRLLTNRFGRRNKLGRLVDKVNNKFQRRAFRRNFIAGSIALLALVAIPSIFYMSTHATSQLFQTDWSGGVGTSTENQYNSEDDIVTSIIGEVRLFYGNEFKFISKSNNSICAISPYDEVYCWGQITSPNSSIPVAVDTTGVLAGKTIKSISAGDSSACAIASDDKAYCWGYNSYGELGNGTTTSSFAPVAVDTTGVLAGKTIKSISAGDSSACAIASDDKAYCWGYNSYGELGNGTTTASLVPVAVDMTGVLAGKTIKSISAGYSSACAIASDDKAYCWGYGASFYSPNYSQLGSGINISSSIPVAVDMTGVLAGKTLKSVEVGSGPTCAIASDDKAYCWGNNAYGQFGDGTTTSSLVPVAVDVTGALDNKTIESISIGSNSACAIASDNKAYCWGNNSFGQFGNGTTTASLVPVAVDSSELYSGLLTSSTFDAGANIAFSKVTINTNREYETGQVKVKIRTSAYSDMSGATDWSSCNWLASGDNILDSTCSSGGERYLQYQIYMSGYGSDARLSITDIAFEYITDAEAPSIPDGSKAVIKTMADGIIINEDEWTNASTPYISWADINITDGGSGVAGYCLYIGEDETADLTTTSGDLFSGNSLNNNLGPCAYGLPADQPYFDMSQPFHVITQWGEWDTNISLNNNTSWYSPYIKFKIQAYDKSYNLSENSIIGTMKYDSAAPDAEYLVLYPNKVSSSKAVAIKLVNAEGDISDGYNDYGDGEGSGVAGIKYCAFDMFYGDYERCEDPANYSGPDAADENGIYGGYYNVNSPQITLHADDPNISSNGVNGVAVAIFDNAGNFEPLGDSEIGMVLISQSASAAPSNLTADPVEADSNNFSFSWEAPTPPEDMVASILEGSPDNMDYCWTVNTEIATDGSNCNWTAKGVTSLPTGPYATRQGENTLYLMTKNEAGNFSTIKYVDDDEDPSTPMVPLYVDDDENPTTPMVTVSNVATVIFKTSTDAPGIPENVEAIDVSTRESTPPMYRIALSWSKPTTGYDKIASYRIMRSTEESGTYAQVASVSNDTYSYVNTSLDTTVTYYYYILACDNAGSCGIASRTVSLKPVGYYTTPATLSDGPTVTNISTKKATVSWATNRETDSKIFISTEPKVNTNADYAAGNSTILMNHSLTLTNLQAGTTYYYRTAWSDSGGEALSPEKSFTTLPAPKVSEVSITSITISGATINFLIENSSKLSLYYGKTESFGGVTSINTSFTKSSYSIAIPDLEDDSKYYVKLNGFDADGNEYSGDIYTFTTLPRPKISNLRFQPIADASSNTTKVTWTTNVPTSSEISYNPVGGSAQEVIISKLGVEHEITISGLIDNTDYTLVARSRDASGNLAVSDTQTFKTALDTRPPKISDISVETTIKGNGSEARGQVIVSWTTDEPGTSQVSYGQGSPGSYSNKTAEDSRLSTEHVVIISDLSISSIYQIQPLSKDKAANESKGANQSAIIGRGTEDVFTIIFNSLRNIFGIKG